MNNSSFTHVGQGHYATDLTMGDIERIFPHVPKYELSEKDYEQRHDSALHFLKGIKSTTNVNTNKAEETELSLNDRVLVMPGSRIGTIRYVGPFHLDSNAEFWGTGRTWYGIELDSPNGKNDGIIEGHEYFTCPQNHGIFAKRQALRPLVEFDKEFLDSSDLEEDFN